MFLMTNLIPLTYHLLRSKTTDEYINNGSVCVWNILHEQ